MAGFASFILLKIIILEMNRKMDGSVEGSLLVNLGLVNNLGIRVSSAVVPRSGNCGVGSWLDTLIGNVIICRRKSGQKRAEVLWG